MKLLWVWLLALVALTKAQDGIESPEAALIPEEEDELYLEDRPTSRKAIGLWDFMLFMIHGPCDGPGPIKPPHCRHQDGEDDSGNTDGSGNPDGSDNTDGSEGGGSASATNESEVTQGTRVMDPEKAAFWYVVAAVVAALVAGVAVGMGQRRKKKDPHPLHGAVKRRMGLFSSFADSALCGSCRENPRVVEMTMSKDDAPYAMA